MCYTSKYQHKPPNELVDDIKQKHKHTLTHPGCSNPSCMFFTYSFTYIFTPPVWRWPSLNLRCNKCCQQTQPRPQFKSLIVPNPNRPHYSLQPTPNPIPCTLADLSAFARLQFSAHQRTCHQTTRVRNSNHDADLVSGQLIQENSLIPSFIQQSSCKPIPKLSN